ncbi:MAG: hypothetical protein ABFD91_15140 [Anaerohalosphaeraceae bacterium]
MKQTALLTMAGFLAVCWMVPMAVAADPDIVGTWQVKADFNGRPMESLLSFSKDKEGKFVGKAISFFGVNELKDIKLEGDKLTYSQINRRGGNESTSTFTGTIKEGKLTGTTSSDFGEFNLEGALMKAKPAVVGNWEIKTQRGDQTMVSTLMVSQDKEGKFLVTWKSQRGETAATDVAYNDGKLTFKRTMPARQREGQDAQAQPAQPRESTYELTAKGDTISGIIKSQRGENPIEGKLVGGAIIGTWELTITSERGDRTQWLIVFPDMTALYGPIAVEKIALEEKNVNFTAKISFGERSFENQFKGQLDGDKLTGEMTSPVMGRPGEGTEAPATVTQKVTGKKLAQ